MEKDTKSRIIQYESKFEYSKGVIGTPVNWKTYFWNYYYKKIMPYISDRISRSKKVLFIGIGSGDIVPMLNDEDKRKIIGLDVNFNSLLSAKQQTTVMMADGSQIPLKSNSIDLVVCNQVLHHIIGQGSLESTISDCYRVLNKGGEFIAIEPNSLHPSGALMNMANRFHKYYLLVGGSDYEFSISPFYMLRLLRNNNFLKLKTSVITFSHPRFPVFLQKIINKIDDKFARFYPVGLINLYAAVK
jgi:SAM-dependent methyltransferase